MLVAKFKAKAATASLRFQTFRCGAIAILNAQFHLLSADSLQKLIRTENFIVFFFSWLFGLEIVAPR